MPYRAARDILGLRNLEASLGTRRKTRRPALALSGAPVAPAPAAPGYQYDIPSIFQQAAGRPIAPSELSSLQGEVSGYTNPAAAVSGIQRFAQSLPKTITSPAASFGVNQSIVRKAEQLEAKPQVETPQPTAAPQPTLPQPTVVDENAEAQKNRQTTIDYLKQQFPNFAINYARSPSGEVLAQTATGGTKIVTDARGNLLPNIQSTLQRYGQLGEPAPAADGEEKPPTYATNLSTTEQQQLEATQAGLIAEAQRKSEQKKLDIQKLGQTRQAQARSYLAGRSILGRTITGAPVETGLGELSSIENKTDAALGEEDARLAQEISSIKAGITTRGQERLTELNKLTAQQFEDRLKLAAEKRLGAGELRQAAQLGKPAEISPGATLYDPTTGKAIFTAPEKKAAEKMETWGNEKNGLWQYDSATETWKQVVAPPASGAESDLMLDIIRKYPDAGITVKDTLAEATEKLKGSKIYRQSTRLAGGAGGKGGVSTSAPVKNITEISPVSKSLLRNPKLFYTITPTERGKVIKELADAGIDITPLEEGKKAKLSATQSDDLVQAQLARAGVVKLKSLLDQLSQTGPVIGRLRQANPYDPQVVAITAEINRIVPGLARGVFKEVGVLTDTDINRYTKTLANPTATKKQIEQLHRDTLAKIDDSIRIITKTYKDLNLDLGRYGGSDTVTAPTASSNNDPMSIR